MENGLTLYAPFIKEIKELIYRRQYEAMKKVNTELILLYWEIGYKINKKQEEQGWGKSVVEILSKELQKEFPGVQGFSARNLWLMRNFYSEYSKKEFLQPLVAESEDKPSAVILHPLGAELDDVTKTAILPPLVAEIPELNLAPMVREIEAAGRKPIDRDYHL